MADEQQPSPTPLLRDPGTPFPSHELASSKLALKGLENSEREKFRDSNASTIAAYLSPRLLVIAGPGSGKSFLFMLRISEWLEANPESRIHVSSFVRKLMYDLQSDLERLTDEQAGRVTVTTLHTLARSILESNGGTRNQPLGTYIKMIGQEWKEVVWVDSQCIDPSLDAPGYDKFESQLYENKLSDEGSWPDVRDNYYRICRLYNAVGFADSILFAAEAITENPALIERDLWIFDEFQDFNRGEESFIQACVASAKGVLLAGDDDQAIYQELKLSLPAIIRGYYQDPDFTNAMLPYCSRCSYHITSAATAFLEQTHEAQSIEKVFLPLRAEDSEQVQVIAAAHPAGIAKYVEDFVSEHSSELEKRKQEIAAGSSKDPYLLILSYTNDLSYLKEAGKKRILDAVSPWLAAETGPGRDYLRLRQYLRHARIPTDNFTFRKVLYFENVSQDIVNAAIREALGSHRTLAQCAIVDITSVSSKCQTVTKVLNTDAEPLVKVQELSKFMHLEDPERLESDLLNFPLQEPAPADAEHEDQPTASTVGAVEVMTMMKSKGLSADHVMILGCDDRNMASANPQLFFVAMTRARKSLHVLSSLQAKGSTGIHKFISHLPEVNCQYAKCSNSRGIEPVEDLDALISYLEMIRRQAAGSR